MKALKSDKIRLRNEMKCIIFSMLVILLKTLASFSNLGSSVKLASRKTLDMSANGIGEKYAQEVIRS